jgi:ArsR family transcriptional regulator
MKEGVFKALSDPTRRKILRLLGDGEKTAGDISAEFPISAPSMSHHFNVLKNAGLISGRKEGQQIYYSQDTTALQELATVLLDLLGTTSKENPDEH